MFNWLNFFYTQKFHRQYKFVLSIAACVVYVLLAKLAQAPKPALFCSLGLGMSLHLFKELQQRFLVQKPAWLNSLLMLLPFLALIALSFFYTKDNHLIYFGQYFCFAFLGFILVLTLQYRTKRH